MGRRWEGWEGWEVGHNHESFCWRQGRVGRHRSERGESWHCGLG